MTTKTICGVTVYSTTNYHNACALASGGGAQVLLGDCPEYWVCSDMDAYYLCGMGYELADEYKSESAVG